ncbi:MAG: peptidylprolyl isomerase [Elusimicrobiota bacterium]
MLSLNKSLLAAALFAAGTPILASAKVFEDVVAKVNGKPLLLSEYRKNLRSVLDNYQRNMPDLLRDEATVVEIRQKVLEQMIDDEVLAQEAEASAVKMHDRELEKGVQEVRERSFRMDEATGERRSDDEMEKALRAELEKEGLSEDQFRDRIRRQLKIRKVVEQKVAANLKEPDEEAIKAAYDKFKFIVKGDTDVVKGLPEEEAQAYTAFGFRLRDNHSERVRLSHILVKTSGVASMVAKNKSLQEVKRIKKRLDEGADFYEVAKEESNDLESAPRGGDLGWILRGWMPKTFEDAAFSLPVGEVSEPVESDFGFHLIRVQEKKAKESFNYDKLRLGVKEFLHNLNYQRGLQALVKRLREKATLERMLPAE